MITGEGWGWEGNGGERENHMTLTITQKMAHVYFTRVHCGQKSFQRANC